MSPRVRAILEEVAQEHRVSVEAMRSDDRHRIVAHARFAAYARLRAIRTARGRRRFGLTTIGAMFNNRHYTTVLSGLRRADVLFGPMPPVFDAVPWALVLDPEETRL